MDGATFRKIAHAKHKTAKIKYPPYRVHGYGAQVYENGLYEGYWEDDKAKGKGIFHYAEGDTYNGEWLNDYPHGFGSYVDKDGAVYHGNWANDLKHGEGK